MNMITKYDENKYFILDTDATKEVQLVNLTGNGWGTIKRKNGKTESVNLDRLLPYEEKEKVEEPRPSIEKIEFCIRNLDGSLTIKTLEGKEAVKWEEMMLAVCIFADGYNVNPYWLGLKWNNKEVPIEEKQNV